MKNWMVLIALLFFAGVNGLAYGQKLSPAPVNKALEKAIRKAYGACVRMWAFDVDRQMRTGGQFSGVIVDADGYILTAAHVNTPGQTYMVMFPDGSSQIACGLGEIELENNKFVPDVAMMKIIGAGKWACAEMGWSSGVKQNEPCISIAYPESLSQTLPLVRIGKVTELKNKYGFMTSTCIMEPGDSGGPLFDLEGRLIGLHSGIEISEKSNFEIPVDLYRKYWTALKKPESYKVYPVLEDGVGMDSSKKADAVFFDVDTADLHSKNIFNRNVYLIESTLEGKPQTVQGTHFSAVDLPLAERFKNRGILLSKSSMVGAKPVVKISGRQYALTIIARDDANDLVLLSTSHRIKSGISLAKMNVDDLKFSQLGIFLFSPLADGTFVPSVIGSGEFSIPELPVSKTLPQAYYNHPAAQFAGGKSIRRDRFKKVFAHDAVLQPAQCGGPVFDANGNFYGINIARYSRVCSVVVPASVIVQLLK